MKLFILTLSYQGKDKLEKLYPTLINSLTHINYEWWIKNNDGTNDNSSLFINGQNNSKINIIDYPNNLESFARGCNFLFAEANPKDDDLVLLLNNDITFNDTSSIQKMINIINNDDTVGIVGCKLNYNNTNTGQHFGVVFGRERNMLPWHFRVNEKEDNNARKNREFQALTGASLLTRAGHYRNTPLNKSGFYGLNENYIWMYEDIDFNLHVKYNLNKKIVYCGETNIYHEESATLKKNPQNKLFLSHNVNYFKQKWGKNLEEDHSKYLKDPNYMLYKGKTK